MALALSDRLSTFDKDQLITLRSNARRLQVDAGVKADEAAALLPLIDAELDRRDGDQTKKPAAKPKR